MLELSASLNTVESLFFERYSRSAEAKDVPIIFILGSPRTGSTLLYQVVVNFFQTFYFSNFIEENFAENPVVGAALDEILNPHILASYESAYGKTKDLWEPSEASQIFRIWFGGKHPSQIKSCTVLAGKKSHLLATLQSIYALTGRVIVTKNAWNCFRIKTLARLFPRAHFFWIRRDISLSALSDLKARIVRGGPTVWNSATTANYKEIQKQPYWEQVVEQQYEYNRSIATDLQQFSHRRFIEIWYEELCDDIEAQLERLRRYFLTQNVSIQFKNTALPVINCSTGNSEADEDYVKIQKYVLQQRERLKEYVYK